MLETSGAGSFGHGVFSAVTFVPPKPKREEYIPEWFRRAEICLSLKEETDARLKSKIVTNRRVADRTDSCSIRLFGCTGLCSNALVS